jgi:hypothetical protein
LITHIALAKWKPHFSAADIEALMGMIRGLKGQIPSIVDLSCGENFSKWSMGHTHAVVVTFRDRQGLDEYRNHPAHAPVGKRWDEMEETGIGIDFES